MKTVAITLLAGIVVGAFGQPVVAADSRGFEEKVLYSFCSQRNCKDGAYPEAPVTAVNGVLYGTTYAGGGGKACYSPRCGAVFSLDLETGAETVLHSFCKNLFCPDGAYPFEAGVIDVNRTLYGTTFEGGGTGCNGSGCGTVFSLDPGTGAESVLHSFNGSDGAWPQGDLIHVKNTIYGTTQGGSNNGMGTLFVLDAKTGAESVLYSFCSRQNCADGFNPVGLVYVNSTLYGTTRQGGTYHCDQGQQCGTAYALDPNTRTETVLHSFGNGTDGWYPNGGLVAVNGILYGTTNGGGVSGCGGFGCGTVFSVDPRSGNETVLHAFCSQQNCADGASPSGSLIEVKGALYGATAAGGADDKGTVFSVDPNSGAETVLYSFKGSDGSAPNGVIQVNGTFYGTTQEGGAHGKGTVFALAKMR